MDIKQPSGSNLPNQLKADQRGVSPETSAVNNKNQQLSNAKTGLSTETGSDRVDISSQAQKIQQAIDSLQSVSDVNASKVADLRTAIASGDFQINSSSTADKLLSFELNFRQ